MKKLKITLNGKSYEVDVEILKDDDVPTMPYYPAVAPPMGAYPSVAPATPAAVAPKLATPSPVASGNALIAPMNGVVIEVPVKVGDSVTAGQIVVILEAMKMKTNIASTQDGKIASINVSPNDSVETGQALLTYA